MRTYVQERMTVAAWGVGCTLLLTHFLINTLFESSTAPLLRQLSPDAPVTTVPDWPWLALTGLGFCGLGLWCLVQLAQRWRHICWMQQMTHDVRQHAFTLFGDEKVWQQEQVIRDYLLLPSSTRQTEAEKLLLQTLKQADRLHESDLWHGWVALWTAVQFYYWCGIAERLNWAPGEIYMDGDWDDAVKRQASQQQTEALLRQVTERISKMLENIENSKNSVLQQKMRELRTLLHRR